MLVFGNDLLYQNGVSLFKSGDKKWKWFYNPFLCLSVLSMIFFRDLSLILVDNETYSTIVGDYAFKMKLKKQLYIIMSVCSGLCIFSYLCHIWYGYHRKEHYLIDLDFSRMRYLLDSVNPKWKILINIILLENRIFMGLTFASFSFGLLYINLSLKDFLIFGLFWSVLSTFWGFSCLVGGWYIQLFYFFFVSKYFTNQFKLINNRLECLAFIQKSRTFNLRLKSLLSEMDATHRALEDSDKFWSKYILINWIAVSLGMTAEVIVVLFQTMHIFLYMFWFIDIFVFVLYFMFLIKSAVSVHNEANKTYRHLYSLLNKNFINLYLSNNFKVSSFRFVPLLLLLFQINS